MTTTQKKICKKLIALSIEHGFGNLYPLQPIADELGIKEVLYDNNTNTGILWEFGPYGTGDLYFSPKGDSASVDYYVHEILTQKCY